MVRVYSDEARTLEWLSRDSLLPGIMLVCLQLSNTGSFAVNINPSDFIASHCGVQMSERSVAWSI